MLPCLVVLPCLLTPSTLHGQTEIAFQRIDVSEFPRIVVYFTATDADGGSVLGLSKDDLVATLDTEPQEVVELRSALAGGESLAVALLFDRSGSMEQALAETKVAASDFLARLSIDDRAAVISFDDEVTVNTEFSTVGPAIHDAIEKLQPGRDTALHDAIVVAVDLFAQIATSHWLCAVLEFVEDARGQGKFVIASRECVRDLEMGCGAVGTR